MADIRTNSGTKALRKIQLGVETTPGTPVAATALWRGNGTLEDTRQIVFPQENIGIGPGVTRQYLPSLGAKIALTPIEETFEQGPYLFEMGALKVGTGAADGAGTGKIYTYPFWALPASKPTHAKMGIRTIEGGDDQFFEKIEFGYADTITLEGKSRGAWMMSAGLQGRQVTMGAMRTATTISFDASHHILDSGNGFTTAAGFSSSMIVKVVGSALNDGVYTVTARADGQLTVTETTVAESAGNTMSVFQFFTGGPTGLSVPAVEDVLFEQTTLAIDAVGGTLGASQIKGMLAATLASKTGIVAQDAGDGSLPFSHLEFTAEDVTLKLTLLMNQNVALEKRYWQQLTPRKMRIQSLGTALTTAGTTYTYKTRNIDLAGVWEKFDPIGEQNGVDIVAATFHAKYDPTAALYAQILYVNQLSSLP